MSSQKIRSGRACAYEALLEWENTSSFAGDILDRLADRNGLPPLERSLARELFFGVLRHLYFLDEIIAIHRKGKALKLPAQCLLRVGLYQIYQTDIADHAAVNETVSLAPNYQRGLINAILRNTIRQKEDILEQTSSWSPENRYSHPAFLIDRWTEQFGEENAGELCRWNNQPPPVYARIREGRDTGAEGLGEIPENSEPVEGFPGFVRLPPGPVPPDWLESGRLYVQDPSTSLACTLVDPAEDEVILDACAAPGGKTALLADSAPGGTTLFATDSNPSRLRRMEENYSRLGLAERINVREVDWARPTAKQLRDLPRFDAILLDVPCSNTGVMRRRIDVRWRLQPAEFEQLAALQIKLLKNVLPHLKPGGRIIYSTCSIDAAENRELIGSSGLEIGEIRESLPWKDGFDGAFAALLRAE